MTDLTIKDGVTEYGVMTLDGERAIVSSKFVADTFGKRHDNVLRDIRNLKSDVSQDFWLLNFEESNYINRGKEYPEFLMTRDGWTFLVMGFTGKKAAKFKEDYINQFNQMEQLIKDRYFTRIEYKPMMEAIKDSRASQGKRTNHFHYSNEANMLNRIVLGCTSKKYREKHGLEKDELRDNIPQWQVDAIKHLQRLNTDLIQCGLDYQSRKELIEKKYKHMYEHLQLTA